MSKTHRPSQHLHQPQDTPLRPITEDIPIHILGYARRAATHLPVFPTPTRDMPGHAYPKSQSFTAAYEPSPLLYKKASVPAISAAPVPVSEEPKGSASPAHLLTKFIESHRALESFK